MAEDPVRKELDALKRDIAQLRQDIAALTQAVRQVAEDKVEETRAATRERAEDLIEDLEARLDALLDQGRETLEGAREKVGEHPVGSVLTAFGLGFIIGRLMDLGGRR